MTDRAAQIAALRLPLDQLPDPLPIPTIEKPFDVTIRPPGSKSITNRALLLAALADGTSELRGALIDADDSQVMIRALEQLGARIEIQRAPSASSEQTRSASEGAAPPPQDTPRITGVNGRWKIPGGAGQTVTLNLHNAGTATRFLTAAAILAPPGTSIIIDGDARMRERPIGELVEALERLGVEATYAAATRFPPIRVSAPTSLEALKDEVEMGTTLSGQFVSAVALTAPFLPRGLRVRCRGPVTSADYVMMTLDILELVGAEVHPAAPWKETEARGLGLDVRIAPRRVPGFTLEVPSDASGATYFQAAAALIPDAIVNIAGFGARPWQSDLEFPLVLGIAGCLIGHDPPSDPLRGGPRLRGFSVSLDQMPDTAMTAAVLACFASPTADNPTATSTLRGLRTLRVKETDRLEALRTELTKLGATVEIIAEHNDESLRITPPPAPSPRHAVTPSLPPVTFETYNDHRMAMALALVGLRRPNVFIRNPACVAKTYPTYWRDLATLYA